jgi:heptosyltransferase-2
LGDIVLTTFLPALIKRHVPHLRISFVVREQYAELLFGNPAIDAILLADSDRRLSHSFLANRIRETDPDVCLDLQATLASRLLTARLGRLNSTRLRKDAIKRHVMIAGKALARSLEREHVVESYFRAARECLATRGVELTHDGLTPRIHLGSGERDATREALRLPVPDNGPVFAVCPGSKWETKRWGEERYAALAESLTERFDTTVLVLGSYEERSLLARVRETVGYPAAERVIPYAGGLRDLACALSFCTVVVSNDSGLMHLGAAVGSRILGIFGPTVPGFGFTPWGKGHNVIEHSLWCRPCTLHGNHRCPQGTHNCMKGIATESVLAAIEEMLRSAT